MSLRPLLFLPFLSPLATWAQTAPSPAEIGVPTSSFVQGFFGLALIIALLVAALYGLRRWGGRISGTQTDGLKIISGVSVGPRERILLVEVADTWLVVGVTPSQIRPLHSLPKSELAPAATPSGEAKGFPQWLSSALQRQNEGPKK